MINSGLELLRGPPQYPSDKGPVPECKHFRMEISAGLRFLRDLAPACIRRDWLVNDLAHRLMALQRFRLRGFAIGGEILHRMADPAAYTAFALVGPLWQRIEQLSAAASGGEGILQLRRRAKGPPRSAPEAFDFLSEPPAPGVLAQLFIYPPHRWHHGAKRLQDYCRPHPHLTRPVLEFTHGAASSGRLENKL